MCPQKSMPHLHFDPKKCVGCRLCELFCSEAHFGVSSPALSRIRIHRNHSTQEDLAFYCHLCPKVPCVSACPVNALKFDTTIPAIHLSIDECDIGERHQKPFAVMNIEKYRRGGVEGVPNYVSPLQFSLVSLSLHGEIFFFQISILLFGCMSVWC